MNRKKLLPKLASKINDKIRVDIPYFLAKG